MKRVAPFIIAFSAAGLTMGPAAAMTLNVATFAEAITVFPKAFEGWDVVAIGDCLEGLVTEDAAGRAIPGQAQSWTVSDDGLTYTFHLRPDAMWSDHTPVVAQDFVTAFRWLFDPSNAVEYASLQFQIRNAAALAQGTIADMSQLGVSAPDEHTLVLQLDSPTPYFLEALTHYSAYPVPTARFERLGKAWLTPENVVCNGPFTIQEKQPGGVIHSLRSATYYDRANVAADEVYYHSFTDLSRGLEMFEKGDIDLVIALPREANAWVQAHVPDESRVEPFLGVYYFVLNQDKPPFDKPEIRRALSMAIDRDRIDPFGLDTPELSAYGWVPEGTAGYPALPPFEPDWAGWPMDQRRVWATAALAKYGYTSAHPLTVQLRYSTVSDDSHQRIAMAVAAMWDAIGVRTELVSASVEDHFNALRTGNFDVGRASWLLDISDPSDVLDIMSKHSDYNFGGYSNPDYEALLASAANERNLSKRADLLRSAEELAVADTAAIPIYWFSIQNLVSRSLEGVVHNPKNVHRSRWISKKD